jgi:hypothetical protein
MAATKQRVLLGMSGASIQRRRLSAARAGVRRLRRDDESLAAGLHFAGGRQVLRAASRGRCAERRALVRHPHYVVDEADQFERLVIDYFSSEYQAGRTPNPCVMCNEKLKFGNLWKKAQALGCDYIATGHYAIIEHHADRAVLRKGADVRKDQSYFLFSCAAANCAARSPARRMSKPEIRENRAAR